MVSLKVYVVPLSTDKQSAAPRQLTSGKQGQTHTPVLSPSGTWAAWLELAEDGYESDRARIVLSHVESGSRKVLESLDKWDRSPGAIIWNREETALWLSVADVGYVRLYRLDLPGDKNLHDFVTGKNSDWVPEPTACTKTGAVSNLAALPGGKIIYSSSSLTAPNELHLHSGKGHSQQLTNFTSSYLGPNTKIDLDAGESYWFEGDKGIQVQGFIVKPKGYGTTQKGDKKWPAVL
jgi:dipeptidyl aminopeptidase/acylaminoacyl peptidase